ncbi:MAG TPA: PEGA domain-containing protein [Bacteroidetes bacterium]|nr:PEGA domain-containing protein [Bacteroidota bacterium]
MSRPVPPGALARTLVLLLIGAASLAPAALAQRVHGRVVGIRGNAVQVRLSPSVDVRPGVRGTIYGTVRGRQGIIARIESARKVGNTWTCTITRSALRVQPGHTVAFTATVPAGPARSAVPVRPPEPGTIVIDAQNVSDALVTSGGVRMGRTEYSQRFSPRNATFYVQKDGFQTERVVVDILEGQTTRRDLTLRATPPPRTEPAAPEPQPPSDEPPAEQAPLPTPLPPPPSHAEPEHDPGFPPSTATDATLTVYVNEPDVDLVINGLPIRRLRDGQGAVQVIPGAYDVVVYKGGYYARPQRITLGANEEQALRFDLIEARSLISVTSDIVGARVKLSGVEVGATPLILPYAPGRFEVSVEAEGYRPVTEFLVVEPDSTAELVVGMEPALGWVFVGASPDAEVRVDGVFVGRGEQSIQLMAGRYAVEVREAGETVLQRAVDVHGGSEESLVAPGAAPPRRF